MVTQRPLPNSPLFSLFELVVFPLDVTNQAMITSAFMEQLALQSRKFPASAIACEGYELTLSDPDGFSLWCSTAACYLERPDLYAAPTVLELGVVTEGYSQGTLEERPSGRKVKVVMDFKDINGFYNYVLAHFEIMTGDRFLMSITPPAR